MIAPEARDSWRELERRLRPFIASRVRSPADVDDVVQDAFLRMQRGLPALRDDQRFGPWLYQLARSAIVDFQRQKARHPVANADSFHDEAQVPPEEDAAQVLVGCVLPFVRDLEPLYREALTLVELEGLKQKEAALRLGLSLPALKSRVARGRAELRRSLEACCAIGLDARRGVESCEPKRGSCPAAQCSFEG